MLLWEEECATERKGERTGKMKRGRWKDREKNVHVSRFVRVFIAKTWQCAAAVIKMDGGPSDDDCEYDFTHVHLSTCSHLFIYF